MPNPVVHFEVQSTDPQKSREFFSDVFGWQIDVVDMPGMEYGVVDTKTESVGINGGIAASFTDQSGVAFYIEVDDIQGYLDKAVAAGGKELMPVTHFPGVVSVAFFSDPAGAPIGLVASETPPAE